MGVDIQKHHHFSVGKRTNFSMAKFNGKVFLSFPGRAPWMIPWWIENHGGLEMFGESQRNSQNLLLEKKKMCQLEILEIHHVLS